MGSGPAGLVSAYSQLIHHAHRIRKVLEKKANMEDDRFAVVEAQLLQAKLIAEEADKKYEEVNFEHPIFCTPKRRPYLVVRAGRTPTWTFGPFFSHLKTVKDELARFRRHLKKTPPNFHTVHFKIFTKLYTDD